MNETTLAARLRRLDPPIVGRISDHRVLLDLRTVPEEYDELLVRRIGAAFRTSEPEE
jgi:seryl-tRNA(Sec) selenium transferase